MIHQETIQRRYRRRKGGDLKKGVKEVKISLQTCKKKEIK